MEIVSTILVWTGYYLMLGVVVSLATFVTEALMICGDPMGTREKIRRIMTLGLALLGYLWKWPLLLVAAAITYLNGRTMLALFHPAAKQAEEERKVVVHGKRISIVRSWETINIDGVEFHVFVSDYRIAQSTIPERRVTHLVQVAPEGTVFASRVMAEDRKPVQIALCPTLQAAKAMCASDKEWLETSDQAMTKRCQTWA